MHYQWIAQQAQLQPIVEQLQHSPANALDTEFIKVDTLYPKLGVLQVNVNQQVYLIDGVLELSAVWDSLFQAKLNIFHACGEDIDLIYHYSKQHALNNVLDTQVAMAFLGHGMQISYQSAIEKILGIHVDKDQTRSDWLARPLSEEQVRYAASDVYYLQDLADHLIGQLKDKNLYTYVLEDCRNYCASLAEQLPLNDVYLDIANYRHSSRQLMQLKQIATWREQLAIAQNKPRSYIIKNNSINKLIERTPKTMQQLANTHELKPAVLREHGKEILRLLNELPEQTVWPQRLERPYRYLDGTKERIEQKIADLSQTWQIPGEVLMRKKWLTQLNTFVFHDMQDINQLNPYLRGWRYQELTLPLIDILQQDKARR
ncbi:ribonuclease D [Acinetobacter puyangensis]|uniref:ribonuclease D n=1 Tax=Acinetobacter puyangensis TaxID=1096779 RepID=UPI003A4D5AA0